MGLLFLPRDSLYESSERKKKKKKKNRFGIIGQPYGTSNNTFPYLSFIIWIPLVLNKFKKKLIFYIILYTVYIFSYVLYQLE